ncbi:MAG: phospholipase [Bacteroidia bacterium]|nr:phospholipase [Bacteroidia bacterium]
MASASRDLLRAAREFCQQLSVGLNGQLFLAGYSEGGYATMALHKLLEEKHRNEFIVTASMPGGGAYHKTAFSDYVVGANRDLYFINSYLWVLNTYNWVYKINRPWSYYLNEPYASQVEAGGVFSRIPLNPQVLLNDTLREAIAQDSDSLIQRAFADNDIHDWAPLAPMRMIHGKRDDFVPPFNAEHAYEAMRARGADKISLELLNEDHDSAISPYVMKVFEFFSQFE